MWSRVVPIRSGIYRAQHGRLPLHGTVSVEEFMVMPLLSALPASEQALDGFPRPAAHITYAVIANAIGMGPGARPVRTEYRTLSIRNHCRHRQPEETIRRTP